MIQKRTSLGWEGSEIFTYKDEPGTWEGVTRQILAENAATQFEIRYFEIEPGGFTTHEKHEHDHCVIVLNGQGEVFLDNEWQSISELDAVHIGSMQPHQFRNTSQSPFGFLCIVDKYRDRPIPILQT